jgi:TonB family protein
MGRCVDNLGNSLRELIFLVGLLLPLATLADTASAGPKLRGRPTSPVYPQDEQKAGHEGRVQLDILVRADGGVASVAVTKSTGYPALDDAAVAAAKTWTFEPTLDAQGQPIEAHAQTAMTFRKEAVASGGGGEDLTKIFKKPCSRITEEVKAFRAVQPDAKLEKMQTFSLTTGILALGTKSPSPDAAFKIYKKLVTAYPLVVSECEVHPDAVYENVLVNAMKSVGD